MTALPPVLSPSSILPPSSSLCAFIPAGEKSITFFRNVIICAFYYFSKLRKSETALT
jgi:hypothetical protein